MLSSQFFSSRYCPVHLTAHRQREFPAQAGILPDHTPKNNESGRWAGIPGASLPLTAALGHA